MHDVYYLILGSLAGGLAIFDKELAEEFVLLRPDASPRRRGVFTSAEDQQADSPATGLAPSGRSVRCR